MHRVPRMQVRQRPCDVGREGETETPRKGESAVEDVLPEVTAREKFGDDEDSGTRRDAGGDVGFGGRRRRSAVGRRVRDVLRKWGASSIGQKGVWRARRMDSLKERVEMVLKEMRTRGKVRTEKVQGTGRCSGYSVEVSTLLVRYRRRRESDVLPSLLHERNFSLEILLDIVFRRLEHLLDGDFDTEVLALVNATERTLSESSPLTMIDRRVSWRGRREGKARTHSSALRSS
jgi:hypothetical protein